MSKGIWDFLGKEKEKEDVKVDTKRNVSKEKPSFPKMELPKKEEFKPDEVKKPEKEKKKPEKEERKGTKSSLKRTSMPREEFLKVKGEVQEVMLNEFSATEIKENSHDTEFKERIRKRIREVVDSLRLAMTSENKSDLVQTLLDDTIGFGPIEPLLNDDSISEVMVNSKDQVYVERNGRLELTEVFFDDNEQILLIADRILSPLNRHLDEQSPYVDARLPDGSRVNIIIPPLALKGPCITIRKFARDALTIDKLVEYGTVTPQLAQFMEACVRSRLNIVVSGGTGSGKTTTLNILSAFIPTDERIVTIEDAAELQLRQPHVVSLESRPPSNTGQNGIPIRNLVANSLRMRPDRIIVGECRAGETLDMLQAMNTGHDGSMTSGHANSPRDMLARLETMVLMSGMDLPVRAIREQIASAVDVIIQQSRLKDGSRKITHLTEVQGMEGDTVVLQDIFVFEQEGFVDGKVVGQLKATGIRPKFMESFESFGIELPNDIFKK